ncbi:DegT/DnrJ/EryC1/StrS family aminotransferase [Candidatus Pelagibacter sp.]|nr:DegT/DnrJ/EryC1/StrS family aminotransferase [Candidatus Pelagibacter sp.]
MKLIPWAKPSLNKVDKKFLIKSFDSNWISDGYYVKKLETNFAKFLKSKNSLTVNNGTSAIHLIYLALNLQKGDEIIFPAYGYMAASNLALQIGIKPIFVDVNPETFCIDVSKIKKKISKKTKLIVIINTYGNLCDFDEIKKIRKETGILILEDAAESLGSTFKNKQSGTFGDFGTFSFQATKIITTGEGGMVTTNSSTDFFNKLKLYRNHGVDKKRYLHVLPGTNFRLTNLQASLGYSQLKRIKLIKERRKQIFSIYQDIFKGNKNIRLQKFNRNVNPLIWTLAIYLNGRKKLNRDKLIASMMKKNIETRNGFYSPNRLKIYHKFRSKDLKVSDNISKNIICLPIYNSLSNKDVRYIANSFLKLVN